MRTLLDATDYCIAGDISSNLAQLAALVQAQPPTAEVKGRTQRWQAHNATGKAEAAKEREAVRSNDRIHTRRCYSTCCTGYCPIVR